MKWLFPALVLSAQFCCAAEPAPTPQAALAIVQAGVQAGEDAPFVAGDYRFLPGDSLYFTFQIAGFSIQTDSSTQTRKISLSYEVTPEDASGIALTPPASGAIEDELNPEDKTWLPKRRVSFVIPPLLGAGGFRVHVTVKDLLAKAEVSKDFPFEIGGIHVEPSPSITVQDFEFLRNANDDKPLEIPAYSPGDTVYIRFDMVGFAAGPGNKYRLSYGVNVAAPDGKPFITQSDAAHLSADSFYPARYVPGAMGLTTKPTTERGAYVVTLTVRDLIANTAFEVKRAFSIE